MNLILSQMKKNLRSVLHVHLALSYANLHMKFIIIFIITITEIVISVGCNVVAYFCNFTLLLNVAITDVNSEILLQVICILSHLAIVFSNLIVDGINHTFNSTQLSQLLI